MNKKRNEEFENIIKNNINNLFIKSKKNKNEIIKYIEYYLFYHFYCLSYYLSP